MRRLAHLEAADTQGKQEATDLQITSYFTELKVRVFPIWDPAVVSNTPPFLFFNKKEASCDSLAVQLPLRMMTRNPKTEFAVLHSNSECEWNCLQFAGIKYIIDFYHFKN